MGNEATVAPLPHYANLHVSLGTQWELICIPRQIRWARRSSTTMWLAPQVRHRFAFGRKRRSQELPCCDVGDRQDFGDHLQ